MNISQIVLELQKIKESYGDLDVCMVESDYISLVDLIGFQYELDINYRENRNKPPLAVILKP